MISVEDAIATPFDYFDFIIQTFNKTTVLALDKIIGNFLHPLFHCIQKRIKTCAVVATKIQQYEMMAHGIFGAGGRELLQSH